VDDQSKIGESRTPAGDRLREAAGQIIEHAREWGKITKGVRAYHDLVSATEAYDTLPADRSRTTVEEFRSTAEGRALFEQEAAALAASEAVAVRRNDLSRVSVDRAALDELKSAARDATQVLRLASMGSRERERVAAALTTLHMTDELPVPPVPDSNQPTRPSSPPLAGSKPVPKDREQALDVAAEQQERLQVAYDEALAELKDLREHARGMEQRIYAQAAEIDTLKAELSAATARESAGNQAAGWVAVRDGLDRIVPGWSDGIGGYKLPSDRAVRVIGELVVQLDCARKEIATAHARAERWKANCEKSDAEVDDLTVRLREETRRLDESNASFHRNIKAAGDQRDAAQRELAAVKEELALAQATSFLEPPDTPPDDPTEKPPGYTLPLRTDYRIIVDASKHSPKWSATIVDREGFVLGIGNCNRVAMLGKLEYFLTLNDQSNFPGIDVVGGPPATPVEPSPPDNDPAEGDPLIDPYLTQRLVTLESTVELMGEQFGAFKREVDEAAMVAWARHRNVVKGILEVAGNLDKLTDAVASRKVKKGGRRG
jgi:predicted  nucleic acid-binding Zn-ribbon protein